MTGFFRFLLTGALVVSTNATLAQTRLSVMSFNTWGSGLNDGKSTNQTVAVIRAAGADIIGVQETRSESQACTPQECLGTEKSVAAELAQKLGFYYHEQASNYEVAWSSAILSRYPIGDDTPNDLGVRIDVAGHPVYFFNIHANDFPYQPFQLLGIEYSGAPFLQTAGEAVEAATATRAAALHMLMQDIAAVGEADLMVITGDFNEPSFRDWTARTATAGVHPLEVHWPLTAAVEAAGFIDTYRSVHPDELADPGFTWSPLISADTPDDHQDRIDFVFVRGPGIVVEHALVVGENTQNADIVVSPWPSDHRAVVAQIVLADP